MRAVPVAVGAAPCAKLDRRAPRLRYGRSRPSSIAYLWRTFAAVISAYGPIKFLKLLAPRVGAIPASADIDLHRPASA